MSIVLSPVNGTVEDLDDGTVGIYISADDPHEIRAPLSGSIRFRSKKGLFSNAPSPFDSRAVASFVVPPPKTERLYFTIVSLDGSLAFSFYVEVGKPQYITNNVALYVRNGEEVRSRQEIGLIVIGSRARLFQPDAPFEFNVKKGQRLEAGKTEVGVWKAEYEDLFFE